jgi:hypothetical protein
MNGMNMNSGMNGMGMNAGMNGMGMNAGMNGMNMNSGMNGVGANGFNTVMNCLSVGAGNSTGSVSDPQAEERAIGMAGASMLLGQFFANGGIGGTLRSVGWGNSNHIRLAP